MKILFVSNLYPPNVVGGYEKLCGDVAAAFVARGHHVTVLTSCYGRSISRHSGQVVHQALQLLIGDNIYSGFSGSSSRRNAINIANITAANRVIDDTRPDAIFCWNLYALDRSLLDALSARGIPIMIMLTDNWLISMVNPDFLGTYFKTQVYDGGTSQPVYAQPQSGVHKLSLPCSAIFGAGFMEDLYTAAGITFARTAIVHNGVRQDLHPASAYADRTRLVRDGEFNLLFAGRVVEIKGVHTAIEALPLLKLNGMPRIRLTIVGESQDQAYIKRLRETAERLGCAENIEFREPVRESELFDLFQSYDAYLFPSLYEPFSLTLILALAAGIPTVASHVGGNSEIINDGKTGLLFPRNDAAGLASAVIKLITTPELRTSLSAGGRAVSAGFTFEKMVDGMEGFINGTLHDAV